MSLSWGTALHWATVVGTLLAMTGVAAAQQGAGGSAAAAIWTVLISVFVALGSLALAAVLAVLALYLLVRLLF